MLHIDQVTLEKDTVKVLEDQVLVVMQGKVRACMVLFVGNITTLRVLMGVVVSAGIYVRPVLRQESSGSSTKLHPMKGLVPGQQLGSRVPSTCISPNQTRVNSSSRSWDFNDYIYVHKMIRNSGKFNFEGCRIPIPTDIRHDKIRLALGNNITPKEERVLNLLEFGMPIGCNTSYGVRKPQKNHFSALSFEKEVSEYFSKGVQSKAFLGPFKISPIPDLCYSPLMSVPKEDTTHRVIVDFSFPPGKAINDGISKVSYLEFEIEFSLPSVNSMVDRINELGLGCLLYK